MQFNFNDIQPQDIRLIVEFHGGQFDGAAIAERIVQSINTDDDLEATIAIAAFATTRGQVGKTFVIPSIPDAERQLVRPHGWSAIMAYRYRITDRLDSDNEILLRAELVDEE